MKKQLCTILLSFMVLAGCSSNSGYDTSITTSYKAPTDNPDGYLHYYYDCMAVGDSITQSVRTTPDKAWPIVLSNLLDKSIKNLGISGQTVEELDGYASVYGREDYGFIPLGTQRRVFLLAGVNNLIQGQTPIQVLDHLRDYVNHRRARYPGQSYVVVLTLTSVSPYWTSQDNWQAVNDGIRHNYPGADQIIDLQASTATYVNHIGGPDAYNDPIYFSSDQIHLTEVGEADLARVVDLHWKY